MSCRSCLLGGVKMTVGMTVGGAGSVLHQPALLRVLWLRMLLPACQLELLAASGLLQAPTTCPSLATAKCRSSRLRQQATTRQCLRRLRRWPPASLVRAPVCLTWQELAAEPLRASACSSRIRSTPSQLLPVQQLACGCRSLLCCPANLALHFVLRALCLQRTTRRTPPCMCAS